MEKFGWFYNTTSKNETEFSDWADKYGHVASADKFLYILGHTDDNKDRLQNL